MTETNVHTVKSRLALARQKIRAAILAKEEEEGIHLHVLIPIIPILQKSLEEFTIPEGVSERIWQHVAEVTGIAAAGAGTVAATSDAAHAGASTQANMKRRNNPLSLALALCITMAGFS